MAAPGDQEIIRPTQFTPIHQTARGRRRGPRTGVMALVALALVAALVMLFLLVARPVIFHLSPADARLAISGLDFNLGRNYLVLPGQRQVTASAPGYVSASQTLAIGSQRGSREITIALEPLPGNLRVTSPLDEIQVSVDGKPMGTVPGVISGIPQGSRQLEFSRYRYFSLRTTVEMEGLGRTQDFHVDLKPAWGWLEIASEPTGADILVDDRPVATTPATVEVLETGSEVAIAATGYKTWRQRLTVTAGATEAHPLVKLQVADGILDITSTPAGAAVTIDGAYAGLTPLKAPVSPLQAHRVDLFLEGYAKASRTAKVASEDVASLAVALQPDIGNIRLNVSPADAVVSVDGRVVASGSTDLALPAKGHRLEVSKTVYQSYRATITPRPGQRQSLDISLLSNQQAYWAERPDTLTSPVGATLRLFRPAGEAFTLGAPRREPGRRANEVERRVALERPFYLGEKEITNTQFRQWRASHTSTALRGNTLDMDQQPVVMVSWQEAALFCNWLSDREGLPSFYEVSGDRVTGMNWDATGYRLPTEAEWDWAARMDGGTTLVFPWGDDRYPPTRVVENYADPSAASLVTFTLSDYPDRYPVSAPVGSYGANHKGLYDMGGNVAEWVNDHYDVQAHSGEPLVDPRGPESGSRHVVRGSSWAEGSRAALRLSARRAGVEGELDIGFRIARYVDGVGE